MASFGRKSTEQLNTAAWDLQRLFNEVVEIYDCTILEGHRPENKQNQYYDEGKSKVKWPDGPHNFYPSKAVDAAPWPIPANWGEDSWKDLVHFYIFAGIVKYQAKKLGIEIRWGGDWDGDGDFHDNTFEDLVHFELL